MEADFKHLGKSFFQTLPPWRGQLDLTPDSIGLKLFDKYCEVRGYHEPGGHNQLKHGRHGADGGVVIDTKNGRAFAGQSLQTKERWSKLKTGEMGEQIAVGYLQSRGYGDAQKYEFKGRNNLPVDLVHDHELFEIKAGLVSNRPDAQKWRLTKGQPSVKEAAWLKTASSTAKLAWNKKKEAMIVKRKHELVRQLSKEVGHPIKLKTMTMVINPDTRRADIHVFDGTHPVIRWRSDVATKGYVGTVKF